MTIAETLVKIRLKADLSQVEVAKILNCTQSTVSKYEKGLLMPRLKKAHKILALAKRFRVGVDLKKFWNKEFFELWESNIDVLLPRRPIKFLKNPLAWKKALESGFSITGDMQK